MKTFKIGYTVTMHDYIEIEAETEKEAMEEFDKARCNDEPIYEENRWIDNDTIFDGEYSIDIDSVEEMEVK